MEALTGAMHGLSLTPPDSSSQAFSRLPTKEPFSSRVLAFFQQQAEIGRQPGPAITMRYPLKVYQIADEGCFSSVDSRDWRKKLISVKATEALIDVFDTEIRTKIVDASNLDGPKITAQNLQAMQKTFFVRFFPTSSIPLPSQRQRYKVVTQDNHFTVCIPHQKLIEIAQRCQEMEASPHNKIGAVCDGDFTVRAMNIWQKLFAPEDRCMRDAEGSGQIQPIEIHGKKFAFTADGLPSSAVIEAFGRLLKESFDPHLIDALVESKLRKEPVRVLIDAIDKGLTPERLGYLSW
jgi:hypothetical protein